MGLLRSNRITPAQIIMLGFLFLILAGAVLLMLPWATRDGSGASFGTALFTATSATCVTGLVVQDTYTYWSTFGQTVILILIQIGGMGVVTMAVAIAIITGRRIGLRQRYLMQESISAPQVGGIIRMTSFIIRTTLLFEAVGTVLLAIRFIPRFGPGVGLWYSVFHSISAFCNAGFDLMGRNAVFSSLTDMAQDPLVNLTVAALIIAGGIGFFVWQDIYKNRLRFHTYRLQTKLALTTSAFLLFFPFLYFYFFEFRLPQWSDLSSAERFLASLFQSVTPRTAGFNTVDLGRMAPASLMFIIMLMLIGGSPSSTAGGFKTTTLAALLLNIRSVFRQSDGMQCFGRRIPQEVLRNASTLFLLYLILFLTGGVLICGLDGVGLEAALFEAASAIGTVGLSLGITPHLSTASRFILILLMYFGRVGGLTLLYAAHSSASLSASHLPQEKISVG